MFPLLQPPALQSPAPLVVPRTPRPLSLDDLPGGPPPGTALAVQDFRQFLPQDGAPASAPTTAWVAYDDTTFYALFECQDDPALIRAAVTRRDALTGDDRVSLGLDTYHDGIRNVWFDVNPYGIQMDGVTVDGRDDLAADFVWHTEARRTVNGYRVLIRVPFRSLRFAAGPGAQWGLCLCRLIMRRNEVACFPALTPRTPGWTLQFAPMAAPEGIKPAPNLTVIPYVLARHFETQGPTAAAPGTGWERRAGLDLKTVFRDTWTLDATLRPDFSQVESDEPQVTVNQRFEQYFPEKRPFFLENANFFSTPTQLFFSRRIRDPWLGLRFTGKSGPLGIGVLAADDRQPPEGGTARAAVLRVFHEGPSERRLGFLATERQTAQGHQRVASLDAQARLAPLWKLTVQAAGSLVQDDTSRESGSSLRALLQLGGKHLEGSLDLQQVGTHFQAPLGFIPRVGIRQAEAYAGYVWRPSDSSLVAWGPSLSTLIVQNLRGETQDWQVSPAFGWEWTLQTRLRIAHTEARERWQDRDFHPRNTQVFFGSDPLAWLGLRAAAGTGQAIAYEPAPGMAPFLARSRRAEAGLTLRPLPRILLEGSLLWTSLREGDTRVFLDRVSRTRLHVQFSRELSIRAILDHHDLAPDPGRSALQPLHANSLDLLLTWLLQPGTALHLGWSRQQENWMLDPLSPTRWVRSEGAHLATGRQAFLKASWRF